MYVIMTDKSKQFFFIKGFIGITLDRCTNKFGSMGSTINFLLKPIMYAPKCRKSLFMHQIKVVAIF